MWFLAAPFVIGALWALVSGRAHWITGPVTRDENPLAYWASVVACLLIAGLLVSIGPVR